MSAAKYRVVLHRDALKEAKKLPKKVRLAFKEILDELSFNPLPATATRLKGRRNAYRIRIGDYRVLYEVHATEIVVYVFGIAHRREVYLRLLRRQ